MKTLGLWGSSLNIVTPPSDNTDLITEHGLDIKGTHQPSSES